MRAVLIAAVLVLGSAGSVLAQEDCAGGHPVVFRVSHLKPGKAALFAKAVADQQAWYRSKGLTANTQLFGPVYGAPGAGASDQMATLHMDAPVKRPDPDAGWTAFVQEFRDSSDIVSETRACLRPPA